MTNYRESTALYRCLCFSSALSIKYVDDSFNRNYERSTIKKKRKKRKVFKI